MLVSEVGEESKQSEEDSWILIRRPRAESDCGVVNLSTIAALRLNFFLTSVFFWLDFRRFLRHGTQSDRVCGHVAALRNKLREKFKSDRRAVGNLHDLLQHHRRRQFCDARWVHSSPLYLEQWLMWRPRAAYCLLRMGRRLGIRDWRPHWPLESVRAKWDERQLHRKHRRHDGLAVHAVAGEINEISSKHWLTEKLSIRLRRYLRALLWRRRC